MKRGGRRYKLKKGVLKKLLIFSSISVIVVISIFIFSRPATAEKMEEMESIEPRIIGTIIVDKYSDLNKIHLKYAEVNGIKGFKSDKEFNENVKKLVSDGDLVKIENSDYYVVDKLTHSHPYLTPKAADLLDEIGKRFQEKLDRKSVV